MLISTEVNLSIKKRDNKLVIFEPNSNSDIEMIYTLLGQIIAFYI